MNEDQGNGDEARSSSKAAEEPEGNILISGCIVLTCLVTIVSLVSLLYYIEDSAGKIKRHATTRTCLTTDCYQMTQQLHFATTEVYPCADFLSHVCGTWAKSAGVDSTLASAVEDAFLAELEQKLRVYSADRKKQDITEMTAILYQSCLAMGDSHPSDKLKKVLENFRLKNWPNFDYTDSADFDVFAEILKADLMWNMNIVFKGERIYRFDIGKPRVSFLPIVLVCPYRGNNASLEQGYAAYVEEIFRIFGYQSAIGTHEVASLHLELCKLSRAHLENDYQYFESILNLTAAHGITRKKWMQHIKPLGKLTDKSILYTNLYFVSSALELLTQNSTTVQVMRYMGYMIANQFAATDSRVQAARDNHPFLILSPPRLKRTMPTPCMHEVTVHFLNAFNMFSLIASNPNRTTNEDIVRLIHTIMAATHERVRASTWMDEDSKARTLKKLKKATVVGPVAAMYAIALNVYERYENLHDLTDDYYDNLLKIKQNDATFQLSGRKRYAREYSFASVDVGADLATNTFYIFAGLLNTPYYAESLPLPVKYGGIGTWIAKAIAQGLTKKGAKRGVLGTAENWWHGSTYREYMHRAHCFAKTNVRSPSITDPDYIDSYLAVRIAFDAMTRAMAESKVKWKLPNSHFTDANMFFLTYCLGICRATQRKGMVMMDDQATRMCNDALNNMPEFIEAWQCNETQRGSPYHICELY